MIFANMIFQKRKITITLADGLLFDYYIKYLKELTFFTYFVSTLLEVSFQRF